MLSVLLNWIFKNRNSNLKNNKPLLEEDHLHASQLIYNNSISYNYDLKNEYINIRK